MENGVRLYCHYWKESQQSTHFVHLGKTTVDEQSNLRRNRTEESDGTVLAKVRESRENGAYSH